MKLTAFTLNSNGTMEQQKICEITYDLCKNDIKENPKKCKECLKEKIAVCKTEMKNLKKYLKEIKK